MKEETKKAKQTKFFPAVILTAAVFVVFIARVGCSEKTGSEVTETKEESDVKIEKTVLPSSLAGKWYSSDAFELEHMIEGFLDKSKNKPIKNVIACILPHAGYLYSGQTAAKGLKAIDRQYKRIIVLGPSHRFRMPEKLSVPQVTHYQTPLGEVPLDTEFINKLLKYPEFINVPQAHKYEHSVQIELPLLQYHQKDFKFVPIIAGQCSLDTIKKVAKILADLIDEQTLVIASSDFVHYGPNYGYVPFTEDVPAKLEKIDTDAWKRIEKLDAKGFLDFCKESGSTICGSVPIAVLLSMLPQTAEPNLVCQTSSGKIMKKYTNSVGYMSIVFSGKWGKPAPPKSLTKENKLSEGDKRELLSLARKTIAYYLEKSSVPKPSELGIKVSDAMKQRRAAFVTLKKHGALRGCIGDIFPRQPLYESVISNAINAAANDWRFSPVSKDEFNELEIEISALTVPKQVSSADKIRIGIDGIILSKNGRRAVYLPQVAPEQGWGIEETLTHLSRKAGLGGDDWRDGAKFEVFEAVVFGEKK